MEARNLLESFHFAMQGLLYALKTQRNMQIHFFIGLLALLLAAALNVSRVEFLVLVLTVGLVIVAEMFNTAIEDTVNLITPRYHPVAEVVKNVAAGAVFLSATLSIIVGYLVFFERLMALPSLELRSAFVSPHLTVMALAAVLVLIIVIKVRRGHRSVFHGGMPSGHSAIAFSLATAILFTGEGLVIVLGYVLAVLLAQSRVEGRIHTVAEVAAGAVVGVLITILLFQLG